MSRGSKIRSVVQTASMVLLVLGPGCAPAARRVPTARHTGDHTVRVGIEVGAVTLAVRVRGGWELHAGGERRLLRDATTLRFAALADRIVVTTTDGSELQDARSMRLEPRGSEARLEYGSTAYGGRFTVRRQGSRLVLVDSLDLEDYLRGVVTWEIGRLGADARAAVEAQAVAARTYTLTRLGQHEAEGFDLYGDERDQVFKGEAREDPIADEAIANTRGLVLENAGELVEAYYSSTCGGHTSWIENVWPKPARHYLRGRRDAPGGGRSYCAASRHFRWTEAWSGADLDRILHETLPRVLALASGSAVGELVDLRVAERDPSARVLGLEIRTTTGAFVVRGDSIRWALRPRDRPLLRSLMFELEIERAAGSIVRVVARGGGNGHGVGMCQNGAIGMARGGSDFRDILQHYYPGATLRQID